MSAAAAQAERSSRTVAWASLALLMALAAALVFSKGSGLTFSYDEWDWVVGRIPWRWDVVLTPHNGHLSLVPILIYKVLFVTVGLKAYWVFRALLLAVHLICALLVFVYVRRRLGDPLGVAAAALILFFGAAWNDILVAFQISFLLPVATGIGALLALERRTAVADGLASLLLAVGLASSSLGLSFALGAAVEILLSRNRRRIWLVLLPAALYLGWYLAYRNNPHNIQGTIGPLGPALRANLPGLPAYVANAIAASMAGLFGLASGWGKPLTVGALALIVGWLARARSVSPRFAALVVIAVSYWGLLAALRGQISQPTESRYLYLGGVLVILLAAEAMVGSRPSRTTLVCVVLLVAAAAAANYRLLGQASDQLRAYSEALSAELGALELAGPRVDPAYKPDPGRAPNVTAGLYFEAVREFGSPAETPAEIERQPDAARQAADTVLAQALGVAVTPAAARGAMPTADAVAGTLTPAKGCGLFRPATPGASLDVAVPRGGLIVAPEGPASAELRARHFGEGFAASSIANLPGGVSSLVRIGPSRPDLAWHARLTAAGPVRVCATGTAS